MKLTLIIKKIIIFAIFTGFLPALCSVAGPAGAETFKIASYNVENLFDMRSQGTEYAGYIPNGATGWDQRMLDIKLAHLARTIRDLSAEIIGLQEVESEAALEALQARLAEDGIAYPYTAIATGHSAVHCALLSRYPILSRRDIHVPGGADRTILQVAVDISGRPLVIFVNHWKSKRGPESRRMASARALAGAVKKLPEGADYIMLGDFNSNYDEYASIRKHPRLNDTRGRTGINHVLGTVSHDGLILEADLVGRPAGWRHYNLWLERDTQRRWSTRFFGRPQTPDAILLPAALYDDKGISYVDNSFDTFRPEYLLEDLEPKRWQRADRGRGRHLGRGYSDHLPVYAYFETGRGSPGLR